MPTGLAVTVAALMMCLFDCTLLMAYRARLSNRVLFFLILGILLVGIWGLIHDGTANTAAYILFGGISVMLFWRIESGKSKILALLGTFSSATLLYLFNRTFSDSLQASGIHPGITLGIVSALCSCLFCTFSQRRVWFCALAGPLIASLLAALENSLGTQAAFAAQWSNGAWFDSICISIMLGAMLEHLLHMPYMRGREQKEHSPENIYKGKK